MNFTSSSLINMNNTNDNNNTFYAQLSPNVSASSSSVAIHRVTNTSHRISSGRSNSTGDSGSRPNSGVRGGVSKVKSTRDSRQSSKKTPQSRRKTINIDMGHDNEMNDDDDQLSHSKSSQDEFILNLSSGSGDTVIHTKSKEKKKFDKRPIEYFIVISGSETVQCSICSKAYKHDPASDSNLRSHLGFVHGLNDYLFPSQVKQRQQYKTNSDLSSHIKKKLHTAAIECIVTDGLPFGAFRRTGMSRFLQIIKPGYRGPSRQTVRKRIDEMYQEKRSSLKKTFETIESISLTTDLWVNSRRNYFVVLTAHYLDKDFQQVSNVISFRRFCGRHLGVRLRSFLLKEIWKLNIQSKIISITTDDGSDIKLATSTYEFGIRFSCDAHSFNRTIFNGLSLWNDPSLKRKNRKEETTLSNSSPFEFQDVIDSENLIDIDPISDEWIDDDDDDFGEDTGEEVEDDQAENYSLNNSEEFTANDDGDGNYDSNSNSSKYSSEYEYVEEKRKDEKENESKQSLPKAVELKYQIFSLLKKIRSLIKMVQKSSILISFLRKEIERKQINFNKSDNSASPRQRKIYDFVSDFSIRWNSTYLMLARLLLLQQVVNDMTYSPQSSVGLTTKQVKKLRSLTMNHDEWELVQALVNVLAPFYFGTKCVSGRQYITLSLSYWIMQNLTTFLTTNSSDSPVESSLKNLLLEQFNHHFKTKVPTEQQYVKLVAAYLDPLTLKDLSVEEMNQAETWIIKKIRNSGNRSSHSSMAASSSTTSSNRIEQHTEKNSEKSLRRSSNESLLSCISQFRSSCRTTTNDVDLPKQETKGMPLSLKQELSLYVFTSKSYNDFQIYWSERQGVLPILSALVRRYCCIPATSVASESAFSISGYVDRKERSSLSPRTLRYLMLLK